MVAGNQQVLMMFLGLFIVLSYLLLLLLLFFFVEKIIGCGDYFAFRYRNDSRGWKELGCALQFHLHSISTHVHVHTYKQPHTLYFKMLQRW